MANNENVVDIEFIQNKQHRDQKAWLEANGIEQPIGCLDPLEILITLEISIELELN